VKRKDFAFYNQSQSTGKSKKKSVSGASSPYSSEKKIEEMYSPFTGNNDIIWNSKTVDMANGRSFWSKQTLCTLAFFHRENKEVVFEKTDQFQCNNDNGDDGVDGIDVDAITSFCPSNQVLRVSHSFPPSQNRQTFSLVSPAIFSLLVSVCLVLKTQGREILVSFSRSSSMVLHQIWILCMFLCH
jgi:hypothetical protein